MAITSATRKKAAKFLAKRNTLDEFGDDVMQPGHFNDQTIQEFVGMPKSEMKAKYDAFIGAMKVVEDMGNPNVQAIEDGLAIIAGLYQIAANQDAATSMTEKQKRDLKQAQLWEQTTAYLQGILPPVIDIANGAGVANAKQYKAALGLNS